MMELVNRLQWRLWGAMLFFYGMAWVFGADPWKNHMAACFIFGLLAIPARIVLASIGIADSWTGGNSPGPTVPGRP